MKTITFQEIVEQARMEKNLYGFVPPDTINLACVALIGYSMVAGNKNE